jgi:hypothetical protein
MKNEECVAEALKASVSGRVLFTDGSIMIVDCENGKLVKVSIDSIDEFIRTRESMKSHRGILVKAKHKKELTIELLTGNYVYIDGWCYFSNGELVVLANDIQISFRNGYYALYSIE